MITSNLKFVRRRLAGLQRRMPDVLAGAIRNLGPETKFATEARTALTLIATEDERPDIDLFVETVRYQLAGRNIHVTMHAPREAFAVRSLRLKNLSQPVKLRGGGEVELGGGFFEDVNQAREAVRSWVLTDKRLTPEEAANPEIAVGRIWHLLGIHPESTSYNYNRQFDVLPDGSLVINPHQVQDAEADLAAGAARLLGSTSADGLPVALAAAGIGGMDAARVDRWLRAVLAAWVAYARRQIGANFKRELLRIWKTLQAGK